MNSNQLSSPFIDPETDEAILMTDEWQRILSNFIRFYQLPGMEELSSLDPAQMWDLFHKEKTAAMAVYPVQLTEYWMEWELDYDVGVFPIYPERPGLAPQPSGSFMTIASISEQPDQAYEVFEYLITDFQHLRSKRGFETPLLDSEVNNAFALEAPHFEGKNTKNYVHEELELAPVRTMTPYDNIAASALHKQIVRLLNHEVSDLSEALREANEAANLEIAALKKAEE